MSAVVAEDGVELLGGVVGEHGREGGEGFFVGDCHGDWFVFYLVSWEGCWLLV